MALLGDMAPPFNMAAAPAYPHTICFRESDIFCYDFHVSSIPRCDFYTVSFNYDAVYLQNKDLWHMLAKLRLHSLELPELAMSPESTPLISRFSPVIIPNNNNYLHVLKKPIHARLILCPPLTVLMMQWCCRMDAYNN